MSPKTLGKSLTLALFALVSAACLALLPHLQLTTSITHFLPASADQQAATLAKALAEGELASTMVLDLSGAPPEKLEATARTLRDRIAALPGTRSVRSGIDDASGEALLRLLAARSPTDLLRPDAFDALGPRLERTKERLGSPLGPFIRELVRREPLGGSLDMLDDVSALQGLTSEDGVLVDAAREHAFLFAVGRASAFDAAAQRAWLDGITAAFRDVQTTERLETSGLARISVAAEKQIRGDIERIGTLSTVGILVLFGVLFRSPRMLLLGLVPLWFGSALAIVATHLVYGQIHGLTLAFGTSLLGVGIDYAEHYFSHYALTPEEGPRRVMRSIWPGLWLGALTTVVGFVGLGLTGFPGVRQIAFFSTVAIAGALVGTRVLLPPWMPETYRSPRILARLAAIAERVIAKERRGVLLVPIVLTVALVPGLARTRFVDDVSVLIAVDPALMAEDARVRERVSPVDPGRFVIVVRPDEEEALEVLGRTTRALEGARADGVLADFVPIGSVLRSEKDQRESFAQARASRERISASLADAGFVPAQFTPFFAALDAPLAPLTLGDVRASPLGPMIDALAPRLPAGQAFVIPLRGVRDLAALRARVPEAVVLDETSLLEEVYGNVRRETTRMLVVGLLLVLAVLVVRYRSPRVVLAAFLPGLLGALGALSVAGLLGIPLNVLHLVAVLLVLSMGVDFGIFVVEGRASSAEAARSLVSIGTATTTTLLSFGLLALSPSPALRTLGTTISIGLLFAAVLCPIGLLVLGRRR